MNDHKRFQDKDLTAADFYSEVAVECPACRRRALAIADYENHLARLTCGACGYNRMASDKVMTGKWSGALVTMNANAYFRAALWFKTPFKNEVLWAYNMAHLEYLESYIASGIRENRNRTRFTMVEKAAVYASGEEPGSPAKSHSETEGKIAKDLAPPGLGPDEESAATRIRDLYPG